MNLEKENVLGKNWGSSFAMHNCAWIFIAAHPRWKMPLILPKQCHPSSFYSPFTVERTSFAHLLSDTCHTYWLMFFPQHLHISNIKNNNQVNKYQTKFLLALLSVATLSLMLYIPRISKTTICQNFRTATSSFIW